MESMGGEAGSPAVACIDRDGSLDKDSQQVTNGRANRAGGHRRALSENYFNDRGAAPGAFSPLLGLPRRPRANSGVKSAPVFRLASNEDVSSAETESGNETFPVRGLDLSVNGNDEALNALDNSSSSGEDDGRRTETETIPFPRLVSPVAQGPWPFPSKTSPPLPGSPTSPIVRKSNGQPLKPSLKSSLSSPNIPTVTTSNFPRSFTRSAPSTPSVKAVHFADKDGVVVFEKTQRTVAVSLRAPALKGDETETETDQDSQGLEYPLPAPSTSIVLGKDTSVIPAIPYHSIFASEDRVHLETLVLPSSHPPSLQGSVLVQNVSFTKQVYVRFTLDDWQTTSEVAAKYTASVLNPITDHIPTVMRHHVRSVSEPALGAASQPVVGAKQWDRFNFVIKLEDVRNLEMRKMSLVNYQIAFEKKKTALVGSSLSSKPISPISLNELPSGGNLAPSLASATFRPVPLLPPSSPIHSHGSKSADTTRTSYPSLHLRLSHYVSPVSSVTPVPVLRSASHSSKEHSTSHGFPPISPPDSPVIARRQIIGGQPATVELVPRMVPVKPMPIRVITPPESKEPTPAVSHIPLPPSPSESDPAVPSPPDDFHTQPFVELDISSRPADGSSKQESTPPAVSTIPLVPNETKRDDPFGMSLNNAPPEFLKRFCFFGSSSRPTPPSAGPSPSFFFGKEIIGASTLTMGQAGEWGERRPQIIHAGSV
ncbi:carbohydrate-binding module family 21 protein [Hydnum rufescens UP504]|uniref:Carbohydrate-binding module family 21 protein n=1 Tax=Hydnum rufescens UP504 TaxID=1448309 RepID=A0A9P6B9I2_9AGAM|nr:carbohydrate-binding module family 21 protein [Hydnum rufescens UP504]